MKEEVKKSLSMVALQCVVAEIWLGCQLSPGCQRAPVRSPLMVLKYRIAAVTAEYFFKTPSGY